MKTALLFPGQGSHYVGMGKALWEAFPDVRKAFQAGSELLDCDVEEMCFQGPWGAAEHDPLHAARPVHRHCRRVPDLSGRNIPAGPLRRRNGETVDEARAPA